MKPEEIHGWLTSAWTLAELVKGRRALCLPALKWVSCKGENDTEISQWVTSATLDVHVDGMNINQLIDRFHWFLRSNPLLAWDHTSAKRAVWRSAPWSQEEGVSVEGTWHLTVLLQGVLWALLKAVIYHFVSSQINLVTCWDVFRVYRDNCSQKWFFASFFF